MQMPQIRPGRVETAAAGMKVIALFPNSAQGNLTIQLLTAIGVPMDHVGVTPPEGLAGNQGMVLAIECADETVASRVETICRKQGAELHRQRSATPPPTVV